MKLRILLVLVLCLFIGAKTFGAEEKGVIRVGLSNQNFSTREFKSANFISQNIIKIIDMSQSAELEDVEANTQINVRLENGLFSVYTDKGSCFNLKGPLILTSNAPIGFLDLNRKGTPAKYRGMIELRITKNNLSFNVINVVDIENYLRGVVPNEMPVSFGLEALKAQAVAARNYATNASISPDFDVVDSTASQVYYGANSYQDISDRAVLETIGVYALYNNKPISALYFSTSAGITDDWDDVFATNNKGLHPYLKARYDNPKQKPIKNDADLREFLSDKSLGFDTNSPKYRWSVEFTREELEEALHTTLQQQSKAGLVNPKYDGDIKLEGLRELKVTKRTQSGRAVELLISSKTGDYKVQKELGIRRVLKKNGAMLPSGVFYVETQGEECINDEETCENKLMGIFDISEKYPKSFKITGGGFGHGVGMSQFGAHALSKSGKKYPEILNHYYSGIILSTIPKQVLYNDYNYWYKTDFYFDKNIFSKAYLYVNNKNYANELNFKVNSYDFSNSAEFSGNRLVKIDITQYLNQGMNSVNFAPLSLKNRGKNVMYQIEFTEK